jgi:hypothetical protein
MKTELRLTDTNAATDSGGRTWGLEGNLFWYLIGGLGLAITVFFVLCVGLGQSLVLSSGIGLVPLLLALGYIFLLRAGKPPGYDRDVAEYLFAGDGFEPLDRPWTQHPLGGEIE